MIALQDGNIVKGKRLSEHSFRRCAVRSLGAYGNDGMAMHIIVLRIDIVDCRLNLRRIDVGQKSQPPYVHADDGYSLLSHTRRGLKQRTVTAHGDGIVGAEVIAVEHPIHAYVKVLTRCDKLIERPVHVYLCLMLLQDGYQFVDCLRLLRLIFIAEDGKAQFVGVHKKGVEKV